MTGEKTKIVFFGTPQLAVFALEEMQAEGALGAEGIVPDLIVTAPDAPAGRGRVMTPPPVKLWAEQNKIDILQPEKLDEEFVQQFTKILSYKTPFPVASSSSRSLVVQKLLFVVFAYGKILPKKILDIPKYGTLNIHPSMLPKLRGPSPIRTVILNDARDEVGVSIILLDEKMDHGPIVAQKGVQPLTWPMPGKELDELLARQGGKLLAHTIPQWLTGEVEPRQQEHNKATYSKLFNKEDALIDLQDDGYKNYLKICAYDGWPNAYFFEGSVRMKITAAHLENSKLVIDRVIPDGGKEINYQNATFS